MDTAKVAIRGSTQDHLQIADIRDDLAILKDGSVALVIRVSAVNFGLLSESEQEAMIYAYAGLLNSLNFSIQVVVRSQRKDISQYVAKLEAEEKKQTNTLLRDQIKNYKEFVTQTVKDNNVLDKKFYIVIPFSSLELGVSSATGSVLNLSKKRTLPAPVEHILEKSKLGLYPKRDHILRQVGRLGLRARQMTTTELVELFYDIYNHDKTMVAQQVLNHDKVAGKNQTLPVKVANTP